MTQVNCADPNVSVVSAAMAETSKLPCVVGAPEIRLVEWSIEGAPLILYGLNVVSIMRSEPSFEMK